LAERYRLKYRVVAIEASDTMLNVEKLSVRSTPSRCSPRQQCEQAVDSSKRSTGCMAGIKRLHLGSKARKLKYRVVVATDRDNRKRIRRLARHGWPIQVERAFRPRLL
jgi:hypothetical protein